ncbi:C-terminal binding protein [Adlercreutzia sp. R21]|uniref:C-terminal binding protein n=1 Tax=Adlercreutzia wanghongyangiae TaxID=3111451 RepID=A0ABU6IK53_9ACTN|nr:C-terminal binding protein [Adlercreutzia sp. R21]MEC4176836.1 C-terminal binding protein [Adlercreutzia sp. R7]MEC4183883.1 C-terminal binding protein [Adlercreutzia sp. R21]
MATIVMADFDFDDCDFERKMVEAAGIRFLSYNDKGARTPGEIIEHLRGADGAITSYGSFTAEVFQALPQLKVVAKTGTGVDNIDVAAATADKCAVCNVVGYGTEVVSDHAIALALACLRRVNEIDADMRAGVWDFHRRQPLGQVRGRTFGVAGYGHIGRAAARKARGLGFKVVVWDHEGTPGRFTPEGFPYVAFEDLLKESDVVSFHTALVPATRHLLNAENIQLMKDDAIVVNTSRGAVIDNDAVAAALRAGKLWGAGIDVFEHEPVSPNAPIMHAPRTVLTSHAAYWSEESAAELRCRCTQNAIDVVLGRAPENCVNPEVLPQALAK